MIVSHREPYLTLHRREDVDWVTLDARRGETIVLEAVAAHLAVDDLYGDDLEDVATRSRPRAWPSSFADPSRASSPQ